MSTSILPLIAQGPTPVQPVDVLGDAAKVASIQNQRAQTANEQARLPLIAAQTQGAQELAHGQQLDNVLKQRNNDALKSLGTLMQQNTHKLPDGSSATDMGSVLGQYRSLYPDKALELESRTLEVQNQRTLTAKNDFDLESNQIKNLGFKAGTAGVGDSSFAARPDAPQVYANLYKNAQQNHTEHLLPATPQQFAQNPSAYASKLSDFVQQSGAQSEVLAQRSAQLTAFQQKLEQGRTMHAQGMASVQSPDDYAKLYDAESRSLDPQAFAALNLPPPKTITNAQQIAAAKQSAALSQMAPKDRADYLEQVRHNTQTEINGRLTAQAEQAKAGAAQGELAVRQFESAQDNADMSPRARAALQNRALGTFGGGGGTPPPGAPANTPSTGGGGAPAPPTAVNPAGRAATSLTPPINGPRATAQAANTPVAAPQQQSSTAPPQQQGQGDFPVMTVDGKKIDLNGSTPTARAWQTAAPNVRLGALRLLTTGDGGGSAGMGGDKMYGVMGRAAQLALKVNPHYAQQAEARKDVYGTVAQQAIQSGNQAIAHSEVLADSAKDLNNTNYPIINKAKLIARAQTGQPEPTVFENARDAYIREVGKSFAGGQLGEKEFDQAASRIAAANSPQALLGAIKINNKLLMDAMQDREKIYNDQNNGAIMGDRQQFILGDSKRILKKQGLMNYEVGDTRVTKDGKKIRLTKVAPNGQYEGVPVE